MNVELMKIVERAVRPLVASHATKLRIREDLYSQLELIYQEELARDETTALANAARRLGAPELLRVELQQTVSRLEQVVVRFDRWFVRRRPGESVLGLALRIATRMTLTLVLWFVVSIGLLDVLLGRNAAGEIGLLLAVVALLFGGNAFLMTLLGHVAVTTFSLHNNRLRLARPGRLAGLSLLAGTSFGISEAIMWWVADGQFIASALAEPVLFAMIFGGGLFALVAFLLSREEEKIRPWKSLVLETG